MLTISLTKFSRGVIALGAGIAALGLLVYSAFLWVGDNDNKLPLRDGPGALVPPPDSLEQLVRESSLIVIGNVTGVAGTDQVYPAGYDPSKLRPGDPIPALTFTNFTVEVTRYIKGSGPNILLLRQTGDLRNSPGTLEFPSPKLGQPMLLFLVNQEMFGPNIWASRLGPWGRMVEEKGAVRYVTSEKPNDKMAVPFLAGKHLNDAVSDIETLVVQGQ